MENKYAELIIKPKSLILDWGINDADYAVTTNGKVKGKWKQLAVCPVYTVWKGMIHRAYSHSWKKRHPSYSDVTVCEDWKYFSNFRRWVLEEQPNRDWMNCELDKDLLSDIKKYSQQNCVFISRLVNTFITDRKNMRGSCMLGVTFHTRDLIYEAHCCNPFLHTNTNRSLYLGRFKTELEAHKAWQAKKHEYSCQLADLQDDLRVADALRQRYSPDKDWSKV